MDVSMDSKFIDISEDIMSQLGFKNLKSFVKSHVILMMMGKIEKYETENRYFEKKYSLKFHEFREKMEDSENIEDFLKEDDYLDWRFAIENIKSLKKQKMELENA